MGCCVMRKYDAQKVPVTIAIATKVEYMDGVRRLTKLKWRQTYLAMEDQWCLDYVVRSRAHSGSDVGCFAVAGQVESFCILLVHGMLWLLLAGGFENQVPSPCICLLGLLSHHLMPTRHPSSRCR